MNIVGNHNNISVKISFAEIKNRAEEQLKINLTDNQVKEIMDIISETAQEKQGISQSLIDDIILDYNESNKAV